MRLAGVPFESVRSHLDDLGVADLKLGELVRDIPYPILRLIDLARALASDPTVLMLDEITAALPADLSERVFAVARQWRERGNSIIFISHRIAEVAALCDRATVLRDGVTVGVTDTAMAAKTESCRLCSASSRSKRIPPRPGAAQLNCDAPEDPALSVHDLSYGHVLKNVSFAVMPGEILWGRGARGAGAAGAVQLRRRREPP